MERPFLIFHYEHYSIFTGTPVNSVYRILSVGTYLHTKK